MVATIATIVLAAGLAPAAPLPDRWLLRLAPDDLPPLPDRFHAVTWYARNHPRFGPSWEFWADFRKPALGRPAEVLLTRTGGNEPNPFGGGFVPPGLPQAAQNTWTARLATHGPLVEFEGRLFTATITAVKGAAPPGEPRLHLGAAVEVKDRVWYQAGTTTPADGRGVSVEEWRIEFRDDPRTADRGTARLRGRWRVLTAPEGESFDADVAFQAGNTYERGRTVTLNWPVGMPQPRRLPTLQIAGTGGGVNSMDLDDLHRLVLDPAPKPRPEPPLPSGLMQPPGKKRGK